MLDDLTVQEIGTGSAPRVVRRQISVRALAAEYAGHLTGLDAFFTRYRPLICPFDRLIDVVPATARLLDIGAGNGLFLYLLGATGKVEEGIGVDIASSEVAAGRRALAELGIRNLRLERVSDTEQWPSGGFGVVSMIDVLHHIPPHHQRSFFEEACRRVSPGGTMVYKDMCARPAWRAWGNRLHDLLKARQWISYRAIGEVEAWARELGLALVISDDIPIGYYGHELRVFARTG
jgi:2-polyprenyl-3-methyl-5-hydroxy-6-metoxy-1,4-benzoquinol methylase